MNGKVSIQSQISAVDAVASGRVSVIATSVSQRELLQKQLGSAVETLRWLAQHEASVRAYVERHKGGRS